MNLYLISQFINRNYYTYDSAVVAAPDEEAARNTHPGPYAYTWGTWTRWNGDEIVGWGILREGQQFTETDYPCTWVSPEHVTVELIGTTDREAGVICASFNAG